jgi:hypothetical protein
MVVLDEIVVSLACKNCIREVRRSVGWLRTHRVILCAKCATEIEFDTGQLAKAAEKAQAAVDSIKDRGRDVPRAG